MTSNSFTPWAPVATLVALVPEMSHGAPKRNLVVGVVYVLLLWVSVARLLSVLTVG